MTIKLFRLSTLHFDLLECSESQKCFFQVGGSTWVRSLFGIWMHDSYNLNGRGEYVPVVNLYVEVLFMKFNPITIEV